MTTLTATVDRKFRDEKQDDPCSKAHALRLEFKQIIEREYHLAPRVASPATALAAAHAAGQTPGGAAAQVWR